MKMNREHILPQALLRLYPFVRGRPSIIRLLFNNLRFSREIAYVPTSDGYHIYVRTHDLIGRHIYLTGRFDRHIFKVLFDLALPGDTLLDIGANIGYVSASFLVTVASSKVVSIEPNPKNIDLLQKNMASFGPRSLIVPVALSDRNGEADFLWDPDNFGDGYLLENSQKSSIKVKTWSCEHLIATVPLKQANLIKIDIQGHEETVLRYLCPHLSHLGTRAILFEDLLRKSGLDGAIGMMLNSAGFKVYRIHPGLSGTTLVDVQTAADCTSTEYIALKE